MAKVQLYIINTEKYEYQKLLKAKYLKDEDIANAEKYKLEVGKKEHLASDYLKNKYVGDYYYNENEKPVSDTSFFNVSHSYGHVIMAYSKDVPVGADVELKRTVSPDLVKYVSSESEYEKIKNDNDFYKLWTSKESVVKCQGDGLLKNIKDIPGIPFEGKKTFDNDTYYSKIIEHDDIIVSITIKDENDFEIEVINEEISF